MMTIADEIIINYAEVASLLSAGVRQARKTGWDVLVSYSQPVPEADPLCFFAERQRAGQTASYWERPTDSFAFAGAGTAHSIAAKGARRFETAQAEWQKLLETAIIGGVNEWGVGPVL